MKIIKRTSDKVEFEKFVVVELKIVYGAICVIISCKGETVKEYILGGYTCRNLLDATDSFENVINSFKKDGRYFKQVEQEINKILNMNLLTDLKELVNKYDTNNNEELIKQIKSIKTRLDDYSTTLENIKYDVNKLEKKL